MQESDHINNVNFDSAVFFHFLKSTVFGHTGCPPDRDDVQKNAISRCSRAFRTALMSSLFLIPFIHFPVLIDRISDPWSQMLGTTTKAAEKRIKGINVRPSVFFLVFAGYEQAVCVLLQDAFQQEKEKKKKRKRGFLSGRCWETSPIIGHLCSFLTNALTEVDVRALCGHLLPPTRWRSGRGRERVSGWG